MLAQTASFLTGRLAHDTRLSARTYDTVKKYDEAAARGTDDAGWRGTLHLRSTEYCSIIL